jgi:hypothetical protein
VFYVQGVFFIISLRIVSHARREQDFGFSFFPALNLPFEIFPLSFMLFFYWTLQMCVIVYKTFDSILSRMQTVLKPLQVKTLVEVITFHTNTNYKIICSP